WTPHDAPSVTSSGETFDTPDSSTHRGSSSVGGDRDIDGSINGTPAVVISDGIDGTEPMDTRKDFAWDEWDSMFGQYIDLDISEWDKKHSPFWTIHSDLELV